MTRDLARHGLDRRAVAAAALLLATAVLFWPVHGFRFLTLDDGIYVVENKEVARGLTAQGVRWAFTSFSYASNWHPLAWLSHMLDVRLFGMDPGGHHVTGVVIHALSVVLLFRVLFALTAAFGRSLLVALLFGIHPLHVESVAWVAERKDLLCGFFWMLCLLAYHAWARKPSLRRYLAVVGAFVLGLLSKPMIVTLPFVLLLLDFWPLGRLRHGSRPGAAAASGGLPLTRLLIEKAPLLALAAASAIATLLAQRTSIAGSEQYDAAIRVANALLSYAGYLGKTLWPAGIVILYPHPGAGVDFMRAAAAGVLLAAISAAAIRSAGSRPFLLVGWLWYLGTLVPVSGLVQVGQQAMANRYTYLPLIGVFIAAAWSLPELLPPRLRRGAAPAVAAAAVCLVLGLLARRQLETMRDDDAVYRQMLAVAPENPKVLHDWGGVLLSQGRVEEGARLLGSVFRQDRGRLSAIRLTMAARLESEGRLAPALVYFRKALAADPADSEARLGVARLEAAGVRVPPGALRPPAAQALRDEDEALAWLQEGNSLALSGHCAHALPYLQQAARLDPDLADAQNNLGSCYARLGRYDEAVRAFEAAVAIEPGHPQARASLARARALRR